jgi:hypothetical protein
MARGKSGAGVVEGSGANEAGAQASGMTDIAKPPPSPPEETPMEIHKPKPVHSLREFLSEIVVIVCGILIALGLEQAVEALHWWERVHEAKTAIHKELVLTTIFGEERIAWRACADAYLADLASAVAASPPQWKPRSTTFCGSAHKTVYGGPSRPWPTEVWHSIEAEGVVSHFGERYRRSAPFTFSFIRDTDVLNAAEDHDASELDPLAYPIILTPDAKIGFLKVVGSLRRQNKSLALSSTQLRDQITDLGEAPTEAELKEMRATIPYLFRGQPADTPKQH